LASTKPELLALWRSFAKAPEACYFGVYGEMPVLSNGIQQRSNAMYYKKILVPIEGCDLIVMGSRGLSDFSGMVMGSVSHRVLRHAAMPVLIVR
jgi:hypothetical protein